MSWASRISPMLVSHVLVPPAIRLLLSSPENRVQGFIAPGHVCTVMGYSEYKGLVDEFHVPIVVGGFEPVDLLEAISMLVTQLEDGRAEVGEPIRPNGRLVPGNEPAQVIMEEVFEVADRKWRGIGRIPRAACGCVPSSPPTTPRKSSAWRCWKPTSRRMHQRAGSAGLEETARLPRIRHAAARRSIRWALRWFRPKAPAPPIINTAGTRPVRNASPEDVTHDYVVL